MKTRSIYRFALGLFFFGGLLMGLSACKPSTPATQSASTKHQSLTSTACAQCHATQFEAWKATDHALANRLPRPEHKAALATFPGGLPEYDKAVALMILGHKPIWQPLIPAPGGRWQPHELAYETASGEWFNVFGQENRQPNEWGHWSGRGMNWNTMCAQCHMTGYKPNYSPETDTFHSTWIEQGIGCIQCHGEQPASHSQKPYNPAAVNNPFKGDRSLMMQTCAPCHARNEALTSSFKPGDNYHDHYRVTLPVQPALFYPDGQQRDEVFNWTSVLTSRMGHAGVSCLDCHDPHTNKTILPVQNNALCMQCHSAPGRVMPGGTIAQVIDPLSHSRHSEGSPGNSCVACHMPTTSYMQRSPRHDHGWLKPDPLLTKELGIPNACSKCHEKEGIDWVIAKADEWYGNKLDSRQRARARAVSAAQAEQPLATESLLKLLASEDIPAWRATYLDLLAPVAQQPAVHAAAVHALGANAPLERAAAVRALQPLPDAKPLIRPLLLDPVRLVRLDAALALTDELPADSASRRELDIYLNLNRDQPGGLLRLGLDHANRGQLDQAVNLIEKASNWETQSPQFPEYLGQIQINRGRPAEAAVRFAEAAQRDPTQAQPAYNAALAYSEAGMLVEAELWLRNTVKRDPAYDRAWYNLGLLLAQKGDPSGALNALTTAEYRNPRSADYPYAAATLHLQAGRRDDARNAALRALAIDPAYVPARSLLSRVK